MNKLNLSNYNIHTDLIIEDDSINHSEEIIDNLTITADSLIIRPILRIMATI